MTNTTTLQTSPPVRYFVRADGEEVRCTRCAGTTLTASIEHGRPRQRHFLGLSGSVFEALDAPTAEAWREQSKGDGFGLAWVCECEMQAALTHAAAAR